MSLGLDPWGIDNIYLEFEDVWTTKEGKRIPVTKLKDEHLLNILYMLQRDYLQYMSYVPPSSDAAQDAWEQGLRELEYWLNTIKDEVDCRGLQHWDSPEVNAAILKLGEK